MHLLPARRAAVGLWAGALALTVSSLAGAGNCVAAPATSENVVVPGGMTALAHSLDVDIPADRARFIAELAHAIYALPEGRTEQTDQRLQRLAFHLEFVARLEAALARVQTPGHGVALSLAARKESRAALKTLVELAGLRLKESNKHFTVTAADKIDPARARLLDDLGLGASLAARLNKGEEVRIEIPADLVPIPLTTAIWSRAVFDRQLSASQTFFAVLGDRQAALLCHGLAGVDDETRQFLSGHPEVLRRLYDHDAPAFAAFGPALRIRDGAVAPAGGPAAAELWGAVLGERTSRPDRFIRELYGRDDGRAAYIYDVIEQLDASRRAFALGTWIADKGQRTDRFKALVATAGNFTEWKIAAMPFSRPPIDPGLVLARVRAGADGTPVAPAARRFWDKVFDSNDLPDDQNRQLNDLHEDERIDAAWLIDRIAVVNPTVAIDRLSQFLLAQHAFSEVPRAALPDVFVLLRAVPTYRMLVLSLDRMGVHTPSVYVAAIRQAARISSLDPNRAFVALEQFQGGLAVVARLRRVHRLDVAGAERLVQSLSGVPLTDGRYEGAVAKWLLANRAALFPDGDDADAALTKNLAGPSGSDSGTSTPARVAWEGQRYRLDFGAPELARIAGARAKLAAAPLAFGLAMETIAESLDANGLTVPAIQTAVSDLKRATVPAPVTGKHAYAVPAGVEPPRDAREIVNQAIKDLSKISKPKDAGKAHGPAKVLHELADTAAGDALAAFAYAIEMDPDGGSAIVGQESRRHDFGFDARITGPRQQLAWSRPSIVEQPDVPWHVQGALLGLDLTLASTRLPRAGSGPPIPVASALGEPERNAFAGTAALMNPFDFDQAQMQKLRAAIARGRERVAELRSRPESLDVLADEIGMDGWRREAVRWTLTNDPAQAESFFALTDLAALGHLARTPELNRWGMAADVTDGCLCLVWPELPGGWRLSIGRPQFGMIAGNVLDLTLAIALALDDLHVPPELTPAVFRLAVRDFFDRVRTPDPDDWLTLERFARAVSRTQIEDYVAALAGKGPLVADDSRSGGTR